MSKEFQIQMVSLNWKMTDQNNTEITVLTKKVNYLTHSYEYKVDTVGRGESHFFTPKESTIPKE